MRFARDYSVCKCRKPELCFFILSDCHATPFCNIAFYVYLMYNPIFDT